MTPEPAEKRPVRVSILNQTYTILTSGDPAEVEELAHTVDELMNTYARTGADTVRAAVLACLHLADQLRGIERDLNTLRQRVDAKSREFSVLLDQMIE
jgi:cell division protein ZapA